MITDQQLHDQNAPLLSAHREALGFIQTRLDQRGVDSEAIIQRLADYQVAIPSWALGAGGTRFGRFRYAGEPATLEQKLDDVGALHALSRTAGAVSLHIPWDIPGDVAAIKERAAGHGIAFDAVNSNTFQDQPDQAHSYKFGSLCHVDQATRDQAIAHNLEVVRIGEQLGSKSLTVWLADGSSFPGQHNFRTAFRNTQDSLRQIYAGMPADWRVFVEYKPYEPNFYSMVIPDWGTSHLLASSLGERAFCLVDLGHHLPNTNIEQIVAVLYAQGKLGGFHFNDSKYGDDDLTVGAIKPYQLFLIFKELVYGEAHNDAHNPDLAWMIDASHNLKDPLEDLLQSLDAILTAQAKALLVDQTALEAAQAENDVAQCQEILQRAYRTDVSALVAESRVRSGGAIDPVAAYRGLGVRAQLVRERGSESVASGL